MKKYIIIIIAMLNLMSFTSAFAGSGKAIVPLWVADSTQITSLSLTNITSHDLVVSVKAYQEDGTLLSNSEFQYSNFQNSNTEIGTRKTGIVYIISSVYHFGFAVITWSNKGTDDDLYGLVGDGSRAANGGSMWAVEVPVNGGNPF